MKEIIQKASKEMTHKYHDTFKALAESGDRMKAKHMHMEKTEDGYKLTPKWYAVPQFIWQYVHQEYKIHFLEYPTVIFLVILNTLLIWTGLRKI